MINEEKLRELIRKHIEDRLDEISTTAGVPGYLTPNAFAGDKYSSTSRIR